MRKEKKRKKDDDDDFWRHSFIHFLWEFKNKFSILLYCKKLQAFKCKLKHRAMSKDEPKQQSKKDRIVK